MPRAFIPFPALLEVVLDATSRASPQMALLYLPKMYCHWHHFVKTSLKELSLNPHSNAQYTSAMSPREMRRHSAVLQVRVKPQHKQLIEKAADKAGLNISNWTRERLIQAARKELQRKT
jgi:hypothetical protein